MTNTHGVEVCALDNCSAGMIAAVQVYFDLESFYLDTFPRFLPSLSVHVPSQIQPEALPRLSTLPASMITWE